MRIALTYNLRKEETEEQSEMYRKDEVDRLVKSISKLGHEVIPVEVSGTPKEIVQRIADAKPKLIFNVAEGPPKLGQVREAYYPSIFQQLGIPHTGGGPSLLQVTLDKRLSEELLNVRGIRCPRGIMLTKEKRELPEDMPLPLFVKPNYEGTSKGIYQDSVVETRDEAEEMIGKIVEEYPAGVEVSQFIKGREITVPFLDELPGRFLDIVEHDLSETKGEHAIYDYELKQTDENVKFICPAEFETEVRNDILEQCDKVLRAMPCPDLGRIDFRVDEEGKAYFLELNALPRLMPDGSLIIAAEEGGISYDETLDYIIRSAARRYELPIDSEEPEAYLSTKKRRTARECGLKIGYYPTGKWNAITDVAGVKVGHVTHEVDDVPSPDDENEKTAIRTGITAIVPSDSDLFNNHFVSGGFVLNGIGEMSGLTQAMEWGWIETPILLTNTMSLGAVHSGIIRHMIAEHPELGRKVEVIIPIIAETNDAFLNDVRLHPNTPECAMKAIKNAESGPVDQGSVGGGTGMTSFDFAGGIGTSSRILPEKAGGYTLGVLVQSNFGKLHNLTVDGAVVGRELDPLYPYDMRRGESFGSVIVVIATDAPLLSVQLDRLSKRAALGLGRVGSFAASTSGEIIFAFSTACGTSREAKEKETSLNLEFLTDPHINYLYEALIECTEEAVLNSMFCSAGQTGRLGRVCPAIPVETVLRLLQKK
jgi:D-alanine--D-alanine ligase